MEKSTTSQNSAKKEILEIRQKTAFVFQHYNLFANKTALENILEGLVVARKVPKEEAIQRAESALEKLVSSLTRITILLNCQGSAATDRNRTCHRSETRRNFAGRADFSARPRIGRGCLRCHEAIGQEGVTMVVVTHEMGFARDVANHVIFMDGGHIIEENEPHEFFNSPKEERTKQFLSRILSDATYSVEYMI